MEHDQERVVELIGEDGVPVKFEHLMTLEHSGKSYVMLTPVEPETEDEEGSVVVLRIDTDDSGEDCYIVEEDQETAEAVFAKFVEILEEEEAGEDDADGDAPS